MATFDEMVVQARRDGIDAREIGKQLCDVDANASVRDVTHAFALAGYPPSDTMSGVSAYTLGTGRESAENWQTMLDMMREVGYPENEIQDALNQMKG